MPYLFSHLQSRCHLRGQPGSSHAKGVKLMKDTRPLVRFKWDDNPEEDHEPEVEIRTGVDGLGKPHCFPKPKE